MASPRAGTTTDNAQRLGLIGPGTPFNFELDGTVFPLLANRIFRIYNVGFLVQEGDLAFNDLISCMTITLQFFSDLVGGLLCGAPIVLARQNWQEASPGPGGVGISADGDPLIAFVSNMLVIGSSTPPVSFRLRGFVDFTNDGGTPLNFFLSMLFDTVGT
jgi:hypothetical protein